MSPLLFILSIDNIVNEILHNIIYSLPVFTCIEINNVQESLETQTEDKNKEDEIIIDKDLQIPPISPNKEEIVVHSFRKPPYKPQ